MRLLVPLLTATLMAACAASASAQTARITQRLFDAAGNPHLVANPTPDGMKGTVAWSICPPAGAPCVSAGTGAVLAPGPQPAGTTFEAAVEYAGQRTVERSAAWGGTVSAQERPVLEGRALVGAQVHVTGGRWSGGWGDEFDRLRVQACRTPAAQRCETISAPEVPGTRPNAAVTVGARHIGWYLFAVDVRTPREVVGPAIGYRDPRAIPPAGEGPVVALSAPGRRVAGPAVRLRPRARFRHGRPRLGTVRCPRRCRLQVEVSARGVTARHTLTARGSARIAARFGRARPGAWRVTVRLDGVRLASRTVRVRR
jgi:hypothetical protein